MAGKLVVNTINTDTAGAVFTTQNAVTGIPKAWVQFDGGATPTINGSFNISSVTYVSTGTWDIVFTTAMPNANYAAVYGQGQNSINNQVGQTITNRATTGFRTQHYEANAVANTGIGGLSFVVISS